MQKQVESNSRYSVHTFEQWKHDMLKNHYVFVFNFGEPPSTIQRFSLKNEFPKANQDPPPGPWNPAQEINKSMEDTMNNKNKQKHGEISQKQKKKKKPQGPPMLKSTLKGRKQHANIW